MPAKSFSSFDRDVLVLWGDQDQFFPVALGRRLTAAFPKSSMHVIAGAKLFVGIDKPLEVAGAIAAFAS